MKKLWLALPFILWASTAHAQYAGVRVVASCGTPSPWPALQTDPLYLASTAWLTVDTNYQLCTAIGSAGGGAAITVNHAPTTSLANNLNVKSSPGYLMGFNCSGTTGGAAGFCVAYNGTTTPSTGALTGNNVLDFCWFDTTARGCSLGRAPSQVFYSAGIQILVTTAASPYTYTTGTDTAAISADFQ